MLKNAPLDAYQQVKTIIQSSTQTLSTGLKPPLCGVTATIVSGNVIDYDAATQPFRDKIKRRFSMETASEIPATEGRILRLRMLPKAGLGPKTGHICAFVESVRDAYLLCKDEGRIHGSGAGRTRRRLHGRARG